MNTYRASSLQSLLESDRGSNDSLLTDSLQLDLEELDDEEYSLPTVDMIPSLESVLHDLDVDSDIISDTIPTPAPTPTPSLEDQTKSGTILRHIILQGVTAQLTSAAERTASGLATSVAVSDMIAIGTSHGFILAFDITQTLRWCCKEHSAHGAVSTMAFNDDNTRLLAGFARDCIVMIDTVTGDTLRTLSDVITPNSGILNIKWTSKPNLALCSDSGGSAWTLSFTRRFGLRGCDSKCFFSGSRGEVSAIEPLVIYEEDHSIKPYCITALATLSKLFVLIIRPRLKLIKIHALTGSPESLPLLSWQMVLVQASNARSIDPVLVVARGSNVNFHQLINHSGQIFMLHLRQIKTSYNILAVHWLGPKTIATIDSDEMMHLTDVRTTKELECIDVAGAGLVYGSAQFKGYATGGNVSPALALAGTHACYNSVVSVGSQLYILGARSLHSINVRSWSEQITYLVQNQRWNEACQLATDGFRNAGERPRRKLIVKERIIRMVEEYLVATERSPEFCLGSIMACLIQIGAYDILWQELWDRLQNTDNYLVLLTDHIECGAISTISPTISQALCNFWIRKSPTKLEKVILKLDWRCLDLHQVLSAVKTEKLYNAQIHLNTSALGDYCVSLTELIPEIIYADRNLGNYMLVYISSCLSGRGYPSGDIPPHLVAQVKHEVLRCLTSIHSNHANESELSYPYLRTLLQFDARETLNVISLAFQEKEFQGQLGQSHRQRIVNILLEIMIPEYFAWTEIGLLFIFISHQIASQSLPEDTCMLMKVVNYLKMEHINNETSRQHSEREQAWLELLETDRINHIGISDLLQFAHKAKCYRVTQYLLEKRKSFDQILNCYLPDPRRHGEMWEYIRQNADKPERKVFEMCKSNFIQLLAIDSNEMTKIIVDYYGDRIMQLIQLLENDEEHLYRLVHNLLKQHVVLNSKYIHFYLDMMCQKNPENVDEFLRSNKNYRLENALEVVKKYELYQSMIYLYEKQGDFESAFNMSIELLKEAPESTAEMRALELIALCTRASNVISDVERETLWFIFIKVILARTDLTTITRSILHAASGYVNLTNLVQLVLNSGTTTGNFGDIKELLLGMLANSKYETYLLHTTARILGSDLHCLLAKQRRIASKGLSLKSIKCIVCRMGLYNNQQDVVIYGSCGHAAHKACVPEIGTKDCTKLQCSRCGIVLLDRELLEVSKPQYSFYPDCNYEYDMNMEMGLQLEVPPRNIG